MRLRRVAVTGFKTFARRSEISLDGGITAIVGPNGSGKSNLVDAVRWALGETNARELRGARMDEVIYSGGGGRPRMGYAEVELVLDNEDARLPVDDAEVAIARRVVRHGESEFRLNGDRVRLRDLERVLGGTGLTQSGYAVVAQNDIDAIIEATPAQRRALVEQAAGVRALRAAAEDALARVSHAEATLRRFEDLLAETEPRLAELAEQAELARTHRELAERLAGLRGSLAREEWRAARAQLRQAARRREAAEARLGAAAAAEAAFAERLAGHRARLDTLRAGHGAATAALEEARLDAERAAGERRRSADRARAGVVARGAAALDERRARAAAETSARECAALEDGPGLEVPSALAERRAAAARAHAEAEAALREQQETLAAAEAGVRAAEEQRLDAEAGSRRHAARLEVLHEAADSVRARLDAAELRRAALESAAAAAEAAGSDARAAASDAQRDAAAAGAALDGARQVLVIAQEELDRARSETRTALARAASARGLVDGALGGRGAVAEAVAAGEVAARRLIDCLTVRDPADAAAVEAALEDHLGAWIVDDLDAAALLLAVGGAREELLASDGADDGESAPPPAIPGCRSVLDAIEAAPGAAGPLRRSVRDVWLAPDPAAARALLASDPDARVALPDGTLVTTGGLRGGGRPGRALELAAGERVAAAAADDALAAERRADAARAAAASALATVEAAAAAAGERDQAARVAAAEATSRGQAATELLAAETLAVESLRQEHAAREAERSGASGAGEAAAASAAAAERRVADARAAAEAARDRAAVLRAQVADSAGALRALEIEEARTADEAAARQRRSDAARLAHSAAQADHAGACRRLLAAELDVVAAVAHGRRAHVEARRAADAVEQASAALRAAVPGLAESERAVAALESERSEVAVVLARAEDEREAASAEAEAAGARVADLAEAVRDDAEDAGPEPEAGAAEAAEREIVRLERRIAAMGPVNALAPDQHGSLAARVATLRAGRDDLGGACGDVRELTARLTSAIDSRFEAVFGAVSVHFHELFAELFPGGRASLRHETPPDPGDADIPSPPRPSGVEILAQPPGKRLQPLSLLSGGERALTALAVILALQQVTPSPFYVFDEVDAPLDDSNVLRFTRLLTRLAATQQFIVVTHNHITMAAADTLWGVTSDQDGVSAVIGVRFDAESGETIPEGNVVGLRQSTIRAAV